MKELIKPLRYDGVEKGYIEVEGDVDQLLLQGGKLKETGIAETKQEDPAEPVFRKAKQASSLPDRHEEDDLSADSSHTGCQRLNREGLES